VQLLFFGLLFLLEISIYPLKWQISEISVVMQTFQKIVDNPAFYGLLMFVSVVMLFSFDISVDEVNVKDGKVSLGQLLVKPLGRIFATYLGLFLLSWFFLIYKTMFMGDVYINALILSGI